MTLPNNNKTIESFKQYKLLFDKNLHHLQCLSQHHFGLKEHTIQHRHCGKVLYYNRLLKEIINDINHQNKHQQ